MRTEFHREYLVQLPLPLAQLYNRAYNDKSPRSRHDNAFYLFEALVKLMAAPLVAAYLYEVRHGGQRVASIDRDLEKLALPSLGQWLGIVRELARHFGTRADATRHPLGHLWGQLTRQRRDNPGLLGLYQRIKQGPDAERTGDRSCSVLQVLNALVQYRNAVFGHGAARLDSWYDQDMGLLLFPAVNDVLADDVLAPLGPQGTRLVYLTDVRVTAEPTMEIDLWYLVGVQGERAAPMQVSRGEAHELVPHCVAVLWPGRSIPLRLDPMLVYSEPRQDKPVAEVLFLNRDRGRRQVEYLSYTTGETTRDEKMVSAMIRLLSLITGPNIIAEDLTALEAQSVANPPLAETQWEQPPELLLESPRQRGNYDKSIGLRKLLLILSSALIVMFMLWWFFPYVYLIRGNIILQRASHEEDVMRAVDVYRTAVASMKDKPFWSKQRALIFNRLGRIYAARRFSRYARDFYRKALQENPNTAVIHANMAFLLEEIAEQEVYRSGDIKPFQEVQEFYEKAMRLDAQDTFTAALRDGVPRRIQMALDRAQVETLLSTPQRCGQHERLDDGPTSHPLTLAFHTTQRHGSFAPRAGEGEVLIQRLIEALQKSGSIAVHDSAIKDDCFAVQLLAHYRITGYRIDRSSRDILHQQMLHLTVMDTATGASRAEANTPWTHGELDGMAETLASLLMQQLSRSYPSRQPNAIVQGGPQP